jgi:CBS domain-containing protein
MTITISDMMRKTVETIQEMASVQEAAKKMKEKNVSSLVVYLRMFETLVI